MSDSLHKKPLAGLLLLAGAAGGPYMLFETNVGRRAAQSASQLLGESAESGAGSLLSEGSARYSAWDLANQSQNNPLNPAAGEHSLQQPVIHSLREVLRFDITPGWIFQYFPRVTTVLADTELDGLRVPLITGTAPSDIAGTLTYNFDRYQRLQRLTLHGVTGDPTRFVAELQHQYKMQQVPSLGGVLYLLQWNGQATSLVHIEPAAVVYADAPYSRFNILIELNQAGLEYGLSADARRLIEAGKSTRRW